MLLKQCNKFLFLSVALHSALFKPTGALRPLRKPTNFGGASAEVPMDFQHFDETAFPQGQVAFASMIN